MGANPPRTPEIVMVQRSKWPFRCLRSLAEDFMAVKDAMTKPVQCCTPDTNLATAAALMWNSDCGALPVLDDGRLAGIITDRDICIALGTRDLPAHELTVREVETANPQTCSPKDTVQQALTLMRDAHVRRLPVVDESGSLAGIISLSDIAARAEKASRQEVVTTIQALRNRKQAVA